MDTNALGLAFALTHRGVFFLDELGEFPANLLDALRLIDTWVGPHLIEEGRQGRAGFRMDGCEGAVPPSSPWEGPRPGDEPERGTSG